MPRIRGAVLYYTNHLAVATAQWLVHIGLNKCVALTHFFPQHCNPRVGDSYISLNIAHSTRLYSNHASNEHKLYDEPCRFGSGALRCMWSFYDLSW